MDIDYKALGHRIRKQRLEEKLTQDQVAEATDKTVQHISNIERGNTKVSLPTLVVIANVLGVSLDSLLCDSLSASKDTFSAEIGDMLESCSVSEVRIISDMVDALLESMRKNCETQEK